MSKIIIPTVYRIDNLDAIRLLTRYNDAGTNVRMLSHAYEFSAAVQNMDKVEHYLR